MPRVDSTRADHGAFSAEHAVAEHRTYVLASLQAEDHFPHAHTAERGGSAGRRAGTTGHAGPDIRVRIAEAVVDLGVDPVKIQG